MARDSISAVYVDYEEAQNLLPSLRYLAAHAPYKEARADAKVLIRELKMVRDISYDPLSGQQVVLTERQRDFFLDLRSKL